MLKAVLESLDDVPEALRGEYAEQDGKFVLQIDGEKPKPSGNDDASGLKKALEKEREARKTAESAMKRLTAQIGDLDPEKAREAMKTLAELEEKNLLGEGKFEEAVQRRVERFAEQQKAELEKARTENSTLTQRLEEVLVDAAIRTAATKGGMLPSAVEDAVLFGKQVFKLRDGEPVPMSGDEVISSGKDPNKPLSMEEWISARAEDRPHWFGQSGGGGATGSGDRGANGAVSITRDEARDLGRYKAAKEAAEKQGVELQIK